MAKTYRTEERQAPGTSHPLVPVGTAGRANNRAGPWGGYGLVDG